jgi:hypothetical protein
MRSPRLDRRTLLRGAGAAVALPLLESMQPNKALLGAGATHKPPVRLAWVFIPNGTNAERWLTQAEGDTWKVSPSLEPLAEFRKDINVFRGLSQVNGRALGDGAGDHARSAAVFLTGEHPLKTSGSRIRVGKSIDQIVADQYGVDTRLPSIELGTEEGRGAGSCDSGYACAYSNNISWRSPTQPMGKEINPQRAFERLFGSSPSGDEAISKRLAMRTSILDSIGENRKSLMKQVGAQDRRKLDEYFNSLREIETRLERSSQPVVLSDPKLVDRFEETKDTAEHIRLMYDLMLLAFQTDTTRIATFMVANEGSGRSFPMIDIKEGHHQLSHHQNKKDAVEKIAKIDRFYCGLFAEFIKRLKETREGEGSLLDNSLIVYGGAISDGNKHDHHDLPIIMAGSGGGVQSGRYRKLPNETPLNNLYMTMAQRCGVEVSNFGDGTRSLDLS